MRYPVQKLILISVTLLLVFASPARSNDEAATKEIPADAKFTCPMESHPDQAKPDERGPYFADAPGKCPRCGMKLKPIEDVAWAQARRAAGDAEVGYTCPDHPSVLSMHEGECPRCNKPLEPFKLMYTCADPKHASFISLHKGVCPKDDRALVPFRGVWLSERMAPENAPSETKPADGAAFRCPLHPLVHSDHAGQCTICAGPLKPATEVAKDAPGERIPADVRYVCPMESCHYFASAPGECSNCGMKIKPIEDVAWARELKHAADAKASQGYVCPMHSGETSKQPGRCNICGMELVAVKDLPRPHTAPEAVQVQMNHVMEHYLELQNRFAADRTKGAAQQALGLIAAADAIEKLRSDSNMDLPAEFGDSVKQLRDAAVKIRAGDLAASRVAFVDLSAALRQMVGIVRPSRNCYGKIYIFHCPMSKGDWLQTGSDMRNPYYGFQMLKCGELVSTE